MKRVLVSVLSLFLCSCSQYNGDRQMSDTTKQILVENHSVEHNSQKEINMGYKELSGSWAEKVQKGGSFLKLKIIS